MFAEKFDDFRRRLLELPVESYPYKLERLQTCMINTPIWEDWIEKFLADTNTDIHLTVEPDNNTYTFYKVIPRGTEDERGA
jgi:hypothetical protein